MSALATLQRDLEQELVKSRNIAAAAEAEGRSLTDTERTEIKTRFDSAMEIKGKIDALNSDQEMIKSLNALGLEHGVLAATAEEKALAGKNLSMGEKFMGAQSIKSYFENARITKDSHIPREFRVHSPAVQYGGVKDILASGGGSTGVENLVPSDRRGLVDDGSLLFRDLTIRNLVTQGQTDSDLVEFVRVVGWTNNAAPVAEAQGATDASGGYVVGAGNVSGAKPQSSMILEPDDTKVVTLAHWVPITKRALSDAAQIRTLIDNFLRYGLEEELEDQMVSGSGTGENFTGILNTDGITEQDWDSNLLVTTRKARTKVRTVGRARPTAFVFNPEDNERFDLLTNNNGDFIFGAPTGNQVQTLWGLPRIESEAVPAGTGIVADWRQAILYDREQAAIQLSDSHLDFFTRNLVAILAELRAAFVVQRPSAFVLIDLTS